MLSRTAENLYWLGRYLERAENVARMVDVEYHAEIEAGASSGDTGDTWNALITATGAHALYAEANERAASTGGIAPGDFLVLSIENPNSIRSVVSEARNLARGLREFISREIWSEINGLYLVLSRRNHLEHPEIFDICTTIKRSIETVFGLYDNTVLLEEGREWFRCGAYIERADMTSRILDAKYHILLPEVSDVGGPLDRFQWAAILRSASAWEAFRKTVRGTPTAPRVTELLIHNQRFPRSLIFCLMALLRHYKNATAASPPVMRAPAERAITLLQLDVDGVTTANIVESGLHEFLDDFQKRLIEINTALSESIFRVLPEDV
ncbi:MAG: alpha-E domain-containing protein [Dehalococcoidia bacterium]|nr:alpha-E domain-containing protein [Dehalococcoidia bacterium]MCA9825783.1 alpha-E domain-containing protein [Dehalococcoidia bacterium]